MSGDLSSGSSWCLRRARSPRVAQARGDVFGHDRVEVLLARDLGGGDEPLDAGRAPGRHDLDVEPGIVVAVADRGTLVQPHHVRHLRPVEPVETLEHVDEQAGERVAVLVIGRWEVGQPVAGRDLDREREGRGERHPGGPCAVVGDESLTRVGIVAPPAGEARRLAARDVVKGVDLTVWVGDGRADLCTAVLEHEDVLDVVAGAEGGRALRPEVDDLAGAVDPELPEGRVVLGRVEHDLAPVRLHGGPSVGEPSHVVGLGSLEPAHAERAAR